jgi:hypothetical protein
LGKRISADCRHGIGSETSLCPSFSKLGIRRPQLPFPGKIAISGKDGGRVAKDLAFVDSESTMTVVAVGG